MNFEEQMAKPKDQGIEQEFITDCCNVRKRFSDREKRLFLLLLQQKCLTYDLILKWISPEDIKLQPGKRSKLYYRLYRLVNAGLLKRQTIEGNDVHILTHKALVAIKDLNTHRLPVAECSELENVTHDLIVAHCRHYLESHGAANWVSDREFRIHADKIPYIPDGACSFQDTVVFIEVELTQKSKDRYDKIAAVYTAEKGPDRVLYFYQDSSVVDYLKGLTREHTRIGFFKYENEMGVPDSISGSCASEEISLSRFLGLS